MMGRGFDGPALRHGLFMPALPDGLHFDRISRNWHDLADRRLSYFIELYRSGRWQHYYTQESFAVRMLDVIKVTKAWGELADRAAAERTAASGDHLRPAA
jgi:hypothetical protein